MIIHDFHFVSIALMPSEANAPLVIDTNTMLTFTVSSERLQPVTRRRGHLFDPGHSIQLLQLTERRASN